MSNILPLALCLAVGMLLRGTGRLPEGGAASINAVIINVALPALTLTQLQALRPDPALLLPVALPWLMFLAGVAFLARFWPSCCLAERVGDAVLEGWLEFLHIGCAAGRGGTLFAPDFPAHGGEGVGEGRALFVMPSAVGCGPAGLGRELLSKQGDKREQAEQAGCRAGDGFVGPLASAFALAPFGTDRFAMALRFHAKVVAHFSECDFDLPALDEPAQDLDGVLGWIGAKQGLRVELAGRVTHEHPPHRDDGHSAVAPDGGVGADLDVALASAIPARRKRLRRFAGTVTRCHAVAGLASTSDRFARRLPFVRGRPIAPGRRGGAGS